MALQSAPARGLNDPEKLVYTVPEAAKLLCVSAASVYNLTNRLIPGTNRPQLESRRIGTRKIVTRKALLDFLGMSEVA